MCFSEGDPCDVWVESRPKARKAHRCVECGSVISPGETYHRINYVFEGSAGAWKECARCEAVRAEVAHIEEARGCEGSEAWCPIGHLAEAISEDDDHYGFLVDTSEDHWAPIARPDVAHLFPDLQVLEG